MRNDDMILPKEVSITQIKQDVRELEHTYSCNNGLVQKTYFNTLRNILSNASCRKFALIFAKRDTIECLKQMPQK
jgi:hypothetical protein